MKRSDAKSVGEIIKTILQQEHLEDRLYEQQIVELWPKVVGPVINKYTVSRYIVDHKFVVHLSSAPLKNELMMHKSRLVEALNKLVDKQIITEIIIK